MELIISFLISLKNCHFSLYLEVKHFIFGLKNKKENVKIVKLVKVYS